MENIKLLGVSIGGTKSAVALGETDGTHLRILAKTEFPTDKNSDTVTIERIFNAIKPFEGQFKGIGIICGGPLDQKTGIIKKPPNLPGFDETHITEIFSAKYGVKCSLLNDADACALAEYYYGAGVGSEDMVFLTFGTGLGAGLILNGKLYSGYSGMAGEIGHVRIAKRGNFGYGKYGSAESYASGTGIAKTAVKVKEEYNKNGVKTAIDDLDEITCKAVAGLARSGDEASKKVFDISGVKLGEVVSVIIDLFNPQKVVIGGVYPRCQDLLKEKMLVSCKKESHAINFTDCEILPALLGEKIDEYSSLSAAVYALKGDLL